MISEWENGEINSTELELIGNEYTKNILDNIKNRSFVGKYEKTVAKIGKLREEEKDNTIEEGKLMVSFMSEGNYPGTPDFNKIFKEVGKTKKNKPIYGIKENIILSELLKVIEMNEADFNDEEEGYPILYKEFKFNELKEQKDGFINFFITEDEFEPLTREGVLIEGIKLSDIIEVIKKIQPESTTNVVTTFLKNNYSLLYEEFKNNEKVKKEKINSSEDSIKIVSP